MAITIIANAGNAGYALPMVSAYPADINTQQLLAWNPVEQALDYVPYTGNALGDFTAFRDLGVGRNAAITGNATIGGTLGVTGVATIPSLTGAMVNASGNLTLTSGNLVLTDTSKQVTVGANKVLGARQTGWAAMTGTAQRTTAATGSVTLPQLAGIVMAIQADLITHGIIGT